MIRISSSSSVRVNHNDYCYHLVESDDIDFLFILQDVLSRKYLLHNFEIRDQHLVVTGDQLQFSPMKDFVKGFVANQELKLVI